MSSRSEFVLVRVKNDVATITYDIGCRFAPEISCSLNSLECNLLRIMNDSTTESLTCKTQDFSCILTPDVMKALKGLERIALIVPKKTTNLVLPNLNALNKTFELNIEIRSSSDDVKLLVNTWISHLQRSKLVKESDDLDTVYKITVEITSTLTITDYNLEV
jgi:hypothetical protein